jgi:hypothetical protein
LWNLVREHDVVAAAGEGLADDLLGLAGAVDVAVSMKLMPASRAAWMIRIDSSWSGCPRRRTSSCRGKTG